jgi:ATP-binding cassette subfamily F protein uup
MPPLLALQDIELTLGSAPLLHGAELSVSAGERICLVGRNGSGKSTLLKVAAGLLTADAGVRFAQPGATIRYLPQEPDLAGFANVRDYVNEGLGPGDDPHRAAYLLDQLGLTGDEQPARLSGGEARRAALARTLAPSPDVLLLDEPTNHLDLPAIAWLERELLSLRSGLVIISHDRRLLTNVGRSIVWLDGGITRRLDQGFSEFEGWRDTVLEEEQTERHKLARKIVMEEHWLRYGVTARRKRNQKRLGNLLALRQQHRESRGGAAGLRMEAAEAETSGKLVCVAEDVSKSYGERTIVRDLSMRVLRGDRLGIIGANGAGKTTLLNLLTGVIPPDSGRVKLGTNLTTITLDQRRETLDDEMTLAKTLTEGGSDMVLVNGQQRHVIGYMKDFLFGPEQANTPVGKLSGGERGRLMLARALAKPVNLLVLDEPTNDLDLETLDLLQELLADHPGTVLVVSHDRDFLDRVATSVIAAEGDGRWVEYAGGYSDMLAQRGERDGSAAPKRAKGGVASGERPAARVKKLSFKDKHALETLPKRIEGFQADIARLGRILADPKLYARDQPKFKKATAELAAAEAALAAAEDEWLALELLREELG